MPWLGWLGAIVAIGFLIIVHEAGHYVVARLCSMRVERFSIGFGPAILGWRSKKTGTLFQIAPIPFGGFVEIRGMNLAEEVDPTDVHAYPNRPAWQRFLTIFAGPATNYLAAALLAFGLYTVVGVRSTALYEVRDVVPNGPSIGKLQVGDRILSIDGAPVWLRGPAGEPAMSLAALVNERARQHPGQPLQVRIQRGDRELDVAITPAPGKTHFGLPVLDETGTQTHLLNIRVVPAQLYADVGLFQGARDAVMYPIEQTQKSITDLYDWATGRAEGELVGPVGMAGIIKNQFQFGIVKVIELLMVLNVALGFFNLFPLPALDGGRLAFLGYELATRRRANPKIETTVHMVGILILIVVMVLVTFKDCAAL